MGKLLLFMGFPALELYVLVQAGKYIGAFGVVCLVFASMIFGGWLILSQGARGLTNVRHELRDTPTQAILGKLLVLLAGLLFILPGFLSDLLGFLLLVPPLRDLCAAQLLSYGARRQREGRGGFQGTFVFRSGSASSSHDSRRESVHDTVIDCMVEPDEVSSEHPCRAEKDDTSPGSRG